ncbi:MAG: OmpA family protein [Rhodospirillales bacterium]|nr:OmpA family protein [Rhodospirillales bacterium]
MNIMMKSIWVYFRRTSKNYRTRKYSSALTASLLVVFLAGCSEIPNALNPVEWYKDVKDAVGSVFEDDKVMTEPSEPANRLAADRNKPAPGADEEIPSLSSVPLRPRVSSSATRGEISRGLVSDRENARRYSSDVIRRQGEAGDAARRISTPSIKEELPSKDLAPPPAKPPIPVTMRQEPSKPAPMPVVQKPAMPMLAAKAAPKPQPQVDPKQMQVAKVSAPKRAVAKSAISSVHIPDENPDAPQLAEVKPFVPPAGIDGFGTVFVSSDGFQASARDGGVFGQAGSGASGGAAIVPGARPLSSFGGANSNGSYQVATILFNNGSSRLGARERKILRQVATQHRQLGGSIRVVGHASSRTKTLDVAQHKLVNLNVSVARAEAVAKALMKMGARPTNVYIGAVSDSSPRFHEYMPTGEAGNRRAEIYIDF